MATTFYLIRHGTTDAIGRRLTGRTARVHLNSQGREEAALLAQRFKNVPLQAVFSSPIERAVETAEPLARAANLPVQLVGDLTEVEFGEWTGRSFQELSEDPEWRRFNQVRSLTPVPGGEDALEMQNRVVGWIEKIRRLHPGGRIAAVSHRDPLKAAVVFYSGLHLDMIERFEIDPASVTVLRTDDEGACVLSLNNVMALPV